LSTTLVKSNFVQYLDCSVKLNFFAEFRSVPFRASELALPRNSECLGMSTFFRGITETVPSLFCGIFSERNSVPNPMQWAMAKGHTIVRMVVHQMDTVDMEDLEAQRLNPGEPEQPPAPTGPNQQPGPSQMVTM
jgi:hypothetical protein